MTDKEFQVLLDWTAQAEEEAKHLTKEQAHAKLVAAGHIDEAGNFTEPYKHFGAWVLAHNEKLKREQAQKE